MENPSSKKKDKSSVPTNDPNVDLSPHPVVKALMDEHGKIPDCVALAGYLGPSDRPEYVRLYLDLTFKHYYEIPKKDAVLYREPYDKSEEARPTRIIVRAGAELKLVQVQTSEQTGAASFLHGTIRSAGLVQPPAGLALPSHDQVRCKPVPATTVI
jgi:hypothetical protein